jgi:hypothetical protein
MKKLQLNTQHYPIQIQILYRCTTDTLLSAIINIIIIILMHSYFGVLLNDSLGSERFVDRR